MIINIFIVNSISQIMNIFTEALFLLLYIFALLYFNIINVNSDNYIKHKLLLFVCISLFSYVTLLIKRIKGGCGVTPQELIRESVKSGIIAVIGYSVCTDLVHMSWSKYHIENLVETSQFKQYALICVIIVSFIVLVKITNVLFTNGLNECDTQN
jgi:hypothetical protein